MTKINVNLVTLDLFVVMIIIRNIFHDTLRLLTKKPSTPTSKNQNKKKGKGKNKEDKNNIQQSKKPKTQPVDDKDK